VGYTTAADGTRLFAERNLILGQDAFKRTDNNSEQMAVDGVASGTAVIVWNGTGASDTGGDWSRSGVGSESAGAMHAGTNGLDTGVTAKDDESVYDNGSTVDVNGTYATISFWLQPKAFPSKSELTVQFRNAVNSRIGALLNVANYVTNMDLDVWQKVEIPITDFLLTADVQKFVFKCEKSAGQQFYIDDIELVSSGGSGPYIFQVKAPDTSVQYHVSMLVLMIAEIETGWDDNKFANITALTSGLLLRQRDLSLGEDSVIWKFNSKDNVDLFGRYHPQESFIFANGKLLVGFMVKPGAASIVVTDQRVLEFVVRDDLSTIDNIRAFAHYGIEDVT